MQLVDAMTDSYKVIRDPIHGNIKVEGMFLELLETPELQRLYNIKQLGFAHLVFPGAHHTRLEHSLGTYHMASRCAQALDLDKTEKEIIECAALLHDIGHGPFSHTLESILRENIHVDHVGLTEKIIFGDYKIFDENEKKYLESGSVSDVLNKYDANKEEMSDIIKGETYKKLYLSQLLNSTIDVDQLDYLARDAYYTGVAYGMIDTERFLQTLVINEDNLAITRKGVGVVESILLARTLMYSSVYFHKTARIAELMLSRAIEMLPKGDALELFKMTDSELMINAKKLGDFQYEIITRLKYRKLFKQIYSASKLDLDEQKLNIIRKLEKHKIRKEKEKEIEDALKIPRGHIIIDVPRQDVHLSEPRINQTNIKVVDQNKSWSFDNLTPIAKAIKEKSIPEWTIMIIADEKFRDAITKNAEKLLFN